ncbi:MAG: 1-(5-phosphoribosyl)-5-[(5-phosphoribosylamino)methylideneamino] imidazole-4-carboxamide isomerase [Candidatus Dormibacteraeota bacterium]|uniref:1-(5-phosphoribosyl)-5-[(5-phosphoribosylamino)methylideneamino] imidazole-4-carboxamide isomerase n=1 Tax=Candidatus Dormiibacter inghamiae TaxID=3127013 RepID=A0A934NGI8_9BACT|nr:1-(5-phosphoribosyl)-5-[(5-phosphoribosylamino)methylideneamino] imidazole-4-carboxamide isomerase [Candidatus Dormibacteraeota bacterium]MBJ7605956.1 1-(5-phosphoribosyl)-5-[(5-phosphoribosylamino)methylideneamino] imidazole-4-carboxamide isomerase [Candidatus Dormibacteraeota bacterium]
MLIIPALDLRAGGVVRLLQGDFARETGYPTDALVLAQQYAEAGARRLHVVDLDGARGSGDNRKLIERLIGTLNIEVQVAGGIRSLESASRWLEAGAAAVVLGTVAVKEPGRLNEVAAQLPGRVLAALDARTGRPAVTGWSELADLSLAEMLEGWAAAPLAGVIVTSIDRDGTLAGPDLDLLAEARRSGSHPITYSGGISSVGDVTAVAAAGAAGVILGKSLLEGRVDLRDALRRCA